MNNKSTLKGTIYIVATPIGNLGDISFRAVEILKSVSWIAAEDTRHSKVLLQHYGIQTPLKSLHQHNETQRIDYIQATLNEGNDIALISDAGTPLISDPGYTLLNRIIEAGFRVSPVPGCCAAIAAISAAGLASDQFLFIGFLPSKSSARKTELKSRLHETATQIYYESPHRLVDCLMDMALVYGEEREAVVARELTKTYENFQKANLGKLCEYYRSQPEQQRGEIVILIVGSKFIAPELLEAERILKILLQELSVKQAAVLAAEITGLRKHELYQLALRIKT